MERNCGRYSNRAVRHRGAVDNSADGGPLDRSGHVLQPQGGTTAGPSGIPFRRGERLAHHFRKQCKSWSFAQIGTR